MQLGKENSEQGVERKEFRKVEIVPFGGERNVHSPLIFDCFYLVLPYLLQRTKIAKYDIREEEHIDPSLYTMTESLL